MDRTNSFFQNLYLCISLILIVSSLFMLFGCGQNNLFQGLSKPEEHEVPLQTAQTYLDNGQYDKALSVANDRLRKDPNDSDALAIKGQALLGKSGGGLTDIIGRIGENKSNTNMSDFNSLSFISKTRVQFLYEAADTLKGLGSTDKNVQLCEGISCMLAAVAKVTWTFDPQEGLLSNNAGVEPTAGADVKVTWNAISNDLISYSTAAAAAIAAATGHEDLRNSVSSINAEITSINNFILNNPGLPLPYNLVLSTLGYK